MASLEEREAARAAKRAEKKKELEEGDLTDIAAKAAANDDDVDEALREEQERWDKHHGHKERDGIKKDNIFLRMYDYITEKPRIPPPEYSTYRREEIMARIQDIRRGPFGYMPRSFDTVLFKLQRNKRVKYWGDRVKGQRDGRGVCYWPDPPFGGGESYFGLWREDQPNGHGCFRWYDGDIYCGEWNLGKLQGYGAYQYGADSMYSRDRYEGPYFGGLRQGTGIYRFAPKNGNIGAVYMGEWLRGMMHGHGMLTYSDGESYIGQWKQDKKQGYGEYKWGWNAGDVAGDKYDGQFYDGMAHGVGVTAFADGGYHKGRYEKGKLNGFGVLRVADGWQYIGKWKDDELDGLVICYYVYGPGQGGKEVQEYDMGEYVSTAPYDASKHWGDLESVGLAEAKAAEKALAETKLTMSMVTKYARRAKESQMLARDAAEEARYMTRQTLQYKEFLQAWYGLKHIIMTED